MLKFVTLAVGNPTHLNYTFVNLQEYLRIRVAFQLWAGATDISRFFLFFDLSELRHSSDMGWLCLTARKFALRTGTGEAMIYRLFMFIFVFFYFRHGLCCLYHSNFDIL